MPKWTDYTTKTEPADNDEVMVLDTAGKANKRLGLSALSDWIIEKIANKVFENLQTRNKTILGAINELNSNSLTHAERIAVNPSNSKSIILDDKSSYLICYSGIDSDNIKNMGFAVVLSRASKERTGGILFIKSELAATNFVLDGNTLKVSTDVWIAMTLTKI